MVSSIPMWSRKAVMYALVAMNILRIVEGIGEDRCTSVLVGKEASGEGGPLTSHTVDCYSCDFRLSKVPSRKLEPGSMRPVYKYRAEYPRYLGEDKGMTYSESNTKKWSSAWEPDTGDFAPIGYIPEISGLEKTYSYVDGGYGIMNEVGLTMGESTCAAELIAKPAGSDAGAVALLDIRELSLIAMERCATCVCAVQTMGALAEAYGYYGADSSHVEAGEALTIADRRSGEAWVFHILADDTGASAVWAARRLGPREVAVVANQFIIGDIPGMSSVESGFLFSANIRVVAARTGLWANGESLNFAKTFGQPRGPLAPYATRRQWRVFSLALGKYSTILPDPDTGIDEWGYDFSYELPSGQTFGTTAVMSALRDHYEGTKYDMTQGPASGPFGDPSRFDPSDNSAIFPNDFVTQNQATAGGKFERAISIFRCSYSFVSQPQLFQADTPVRGTTTFHSPPAFWTAQYAPHSASYVLVFPEADHVPPSLAAGSLHEVDSTAQYWAHALVGNWAARFFVVAQPLVVDVRDDVDKQTRADYRDLLYRSDSKPSQKQLADFADSAAAAAVDRWWKLFWDLCARVKDGQRIDDRTAEKINPVHIFYRASWLKQVNFFFNSQPDATTSLFSSLPSTSKFYDTVNPRLQLGLSFLAGALVATIILRAGSQ